MQRCTHDECGAPAPYRDMQTWRDLCREHLAFHLVRSRPLEAAASAIGFTEDAAFDALEAVRALREASTHPSFAGAEARRTVQQCQDRLNAAASAISDASLELGLL
jgi:hypothetical protein